MTLGARRRRPPTPGFVANELWRRAGAVPSFHLTPGRTGTAVDLISSTVLGGGTVNCATPAWDVGPGGIVFQPAANTPVIGYDLATLQPRGLRVYQAIVQRSLSTRDLTQAVWVKSSVTATRDQVGADGTANTATRLTATASDGTCLQTLTSASATHVSGFFVRRITGSGTVEITQNGGTTWTAITLTSTFGRFEVAAATVTNPQIGFRIRSSGDEIAVDFTQCQSASVLGPPLPNASTTLTASSTADVITIAGSDFTRIWNQSAVTIHVGWELPDVSSTRDDQVLFLADASGLPAVAMRMGFSAGSRRLRYYAQTSAGVFTYAIDGAANSSATGKTAFAFSSLNDSAASENGASIVTDTVGDFSNQTTSQIVLGGTGSAFANGYISEAAVFRSRIANANLQALTP